MKAIAKTPVRYKGETIPAGQEFEITAEDFELHGGILVAAEEDALKEKGSKPRSK